MRITLIHNPGAGDEGLSGEQIAALIREAGHKVVCRSSKEKGFASILDDPGDMVAVAGGDGTVRKVAMRLIGHRVPIAILPLGTANNIAHTLGVHGSVEDIVAGWRSSERKRFDVGVVNTPSRQGLFIEGMGLGLFSKAMTLLRSIDEEHSIEFDDTVSKIHGDVGSIKAMIADYRAHDLTVTLDGQDYSGRYLLVEAMNINSVGPNLLLAPGADPSDGWLDFVFVSESDREKFEAYLTRRLERKDAPVNFTVRRGRTLQVRWEGAEIHLDDKIWTEQVSSPSDIHDDPIINVSIKNHALEFLAPGR